ncbi:MULTISPECIES: SDR family NAD(P)-dependent oxidoreductase [unclassified Streptomyces]|uniref:SDR family NAD(P)-dependent oxidoreductase n=1 Tax=unclassified Streptomyces TaxID=2593676 RepID=UPI000AB04EE2|nr:MULTISPECIES: SDR family NAD(P)-dependent oxidoreductase [unclassified Streptomyces]AZM64275.1 dehydrogenase [Streptomyces sp. WAC 01438]RSM93417.1 dehydrogenase [Streptomyces sp. WAC 01420]
MQSNRVVVITGAAGGIGAVLVARFLANGDTVIATDLSEQALDRLRDGFDSDAALVTVAADLSGEDGNAALAAAIREHADRVDVLINCAGWFPITSFEDIEPEEWRRVIDVNLTGTYLTTRALLPLMKENGWGRIVNFGSGSFFDGTRFQAHYVAAKAGVIGFTRSLSREVGDWGITVNVIAPGLTVTEPVRRTFPQEVLEAQRAGRALKRDQVPEDLVGPVFFLASPDAGFITGQTINVDGGKFMT